MEEKPVTIHDAIKQMSVEEINEWLKGDPRGLDVRKIMEGTREGKVVADLKRIGDDPNLRLESVGIEEGGEVTITYREVLVARNPPVQIIDKMDINRFLNAKDINQNEND